MPKKIPGKLNSPLPQAEFDRLPLATLSIPVHGIFLRLHGTDPAIGKPWGPIFFSRQGRSRFDPVTGPGTSYVGETLAGVLLEKFDDLWGPINSTTRSLTQAQLDDWWVSFVAVPLVHLFDAGGANLSKIGTDMQLLTGSHATARRWALRFARHPAKLNGIYYPSRHNMSARNLALFKARNLQPAKFDAALTAKSAGQWLIDDNGPMVCGPPIRLRNHPDLPKAMMDLDVGLLP